MKRLSGPINIFSIIAACFLLFFTESCIKEDLSGCTEYQFWVKVTDPDGETLSLSTADPLNVYLFDQDDRFVRMLSTNADGKVILGYDQDEPLTLVAWGNLKEDTLDVSDPVKGESIDDLFVTLRKSGAYHLSPTDIFYASFSKDASGTITTRSARMEKDTITLSLTRQVASVTITSRHLDDRFGSDTAGMYYVVRQVGTTLNFSGDLSGDTASYCPACAFDANDYLVTPVFRVLPTQTDGTLYVDLYRGDSLLYTSGTDSSGNTLQSISGKQLNITIDFQNGVGLTVTVTPWGEVWQETEM
jgi:hypothetical protein